MELAAQVPGRQVLYKTYSLAKKDIRPWRKTQQPDTHKEEFMNRFWKIYIVALIVLIGVFWGIISTCIDRGLHLIGSKLSSTGEQQRTPPKSPIEVWGGWIGLETLVDKEGNPVWSPAYYVNPKLFQVPVDQVGHLIVPLPPISVNCEINVGRNFWLHRETVIDKLEKEGGIPVEKKEVTTGFKSPQLKFEQPPEFLFPRVIRAYFDHLKWLNEQFDEAIKKYSDKQVARDAQKHGKEEELKENIRKLRQDSEELQKYRKWLGKCEDYVLVLAKRKISDSRLMNVVWEFYVIRKDRLDEELNRDK
ncbi:MAG: hypothetical protein FJZ04_00290 [Candidatus Moranbacteria bacterium]|nr:hypothetical protein [Candidatus Moranbacteria bacterium]